MARSSPSCPWYCVFTVVSAGVLGGCMSGVGLRRNAGPCAARRCWTRCASSGAIRRADCPACWSVRKRARIRLVARFPRTLGRTCDFAAAEWPSRCAGTGPAGFVFGLAIRGANIVATSWSAPHPDQSRCQCCASKWIGWIGFLNDLFYGRSYSAGPAEVSIPFLFDENPLLYRSAWPESSREASERFLMETLGRTQSERRRRLTLAGGFRLLRLFGIDRLDAPAHAAVRGSAGPDD